MPHWPRGKSGPREQQQRNPLYRNDVPRLARGARPSRRGGWVEREKKLTAPRTTEYTVASDLMLAKCTPSGRQEFHVLPQYKPHSSSSTNLWQNERIALPKHGIVDSVSRRITLRVMSGSTARHRDIISNLGLDTCWLMMVTSRGIETE